MLLNILLLIILVCAVLVVLHKKHHGQGHCIKNCNECKNPCPHYGRYR